MEKNSFLASNTVEHSHVTVYAESEDESFIKKLRLLLNNKDYKILLPKDYETLAQAARNSGLILILLDDLDHNSQTFALRLREDRLVAADIVGLSKQQQELGSKLYLKGYDLFFSYDDFIEEDLRRLLVQRLGIGSQRLAQLLNEEEHRRFSDALSCAPASVMVFDAEKRIVFVSEHYFRAYPQSAPRLGRGLSVYDAFDMMSKEENLDPGSEQYQEIRRFWHNLNGQIEFTLDTGVSYRLTAVLLSNQRGTIVTAVNISDFVENKQRLEDALHELHQLKSSG